MATNHKPAIKGTEHAVWRRLKLLLFSNQIAEEKQDRHLESKLIAEASGILNWLLEGVKRWREEGLKTPSAVISATNEYRNEMDVIGQFIKDQCVEKEGITTKVKDIYTAYHKWCADNNERAVSDRYFSLRMQEIGFERTRNSETRFWKGLGLKTETS